MSERNEFDDEFSQKDQSGIAALFTGIIYGLIIGILIGLFFGWMYL